MRQPSWQELELRRRRFEKKGIKTRTRRPVSGSGSKYFHRNSLFTASFDRAEISRSLDNLDKKRSGHVRGRSTERRVLKTVEARIFAIERNTRAFLENCFIIPRRRRQLYRGKNAAFYPSLRSTLLASAIGNQHYRGEVNHRQRIDSLSRKGGPLLRSGNGRENQGSECKSRWFLRTIETSRSIQCRSI